MVRINGRSVRVAAACGVLMVVAAASAPARADCYEDIGCTDSDMMSVRDLEDLSCQNLWHVRNRIYDENGFCFKTARAKAAFDNSDCWVQSQAKVKLSTIERHNVNAIVEAESNNSCN